ncbi:hypothetical protein KUTeg_014076 [Tegillarca granosa]|uniref:Elongation of very long chain fatty acids protein n=1 Tax=Tegillarca granosa TaxID=220873 RepID=A0ABQ9EVL1_TEGGR|nr:hypothetical protein KUTeg_014076 [Tegillarca granosa]
MQIFYLTSINMDILNSIVIHYTNMMALGDPRVESWAFMGSPFPTLMTLTAYFIFVYNGPGIMKDRKPFDLKFILIIYNFFMVFLSFYIFVEIGLGGWFTDYSLGCQPVDYSNSPKAIRMARAIWLFLITKYIELSDTVFFVLRKKQNQLTFLHVYHHGWLPFSWWLGVKFVPGGFGTFHAWINAFVHTVMYLYYGLAALGPSVQKYLWWKKYITTLQLAQFVIVITHTSQIIFLRDCDYPPPFAYAILIYTLSFFFLFMKFYRKTYRKTTSVQEEGKPSTFYKNGLVRNGQSNGFKPKNN